VECRESEYTVTDTNLHYFVGTFMHTPAIDSLEILQDNLMAVDTHSGDIVSILSPDHPHYAQSLESAKQQRILTQISGDSFFIPGLVDLHIHAPQWPQLGKALHLPLEDWLQNYTFPLEARYEDVGFANAMYSSLVSTLLANGTTSAVYFATIHLDATQRLAELCAEKGQRAWVGRVAMDEHSQCPSFYRDNSADAALRASEASLHSIQKMDGANNRVQPILTPRFIPSCTDELLIGLGQLASEYNCHVQTHCSESDWEHQFVQERLASTDTMALDKFGLLTRKTVLAHSNFIDDQDMAVIKNRCSGIAHCPLSNQYFAGAVFPLRAAIDKGLNVGLGTDISGGPSASQFDSCRHAMSSSRLLESGVDPSIEQAQRGNLNAGVNFIEAFYLATAGGGVVLDAPIGQFKVGYQFDALHIDTTVNESNLKYFPNLDSHEDVFQKIIYAATLANIKGVWVAGIPIARFFQP